MSSSLFRDIIGDSWTMRYDSRRYLKVYRHDTIPGLERYDTQSSPEAQIHSRYYYERKFYRRALSVHNAILLSMGANPLMLPEE